MKKIVKLLIVIISIVVFVSISDFGVYDEIDLEKTKKEIFKLENTYFDFKQVDEYLYNESNLFGILEKVSEEELEEYGVTLDYIDKNNDELVLSFAESQESENEIKGLYSYIVVKPAEDKKDLLEEQFDNYYQKLLDDYSEKEDSKEDVKEHLISVMKKEYDGYLIYILSNDNVFAWEQIQKISHSNIFENVKELSLDEFLTTFSLDKKDIVEYQIYFSDNSYESNLYMIVRPKKQSLEKVKNSLDKYMDKYEKEWSKHAIDEYEMVKNRTVTEVGSYLVYIVSKDNATVLETIKNSVIKKD